MRTLIQKQVSAPFEDWKQAALEPVPGRSDPAAPPAPASPAGRLRPAAVLVPLIDRPEGLSVLLTQRTAHLTDHAGQISFPGGRAEPIDTDPIQTALRETEEEIGLARAAIEVVGRLDNYETGTGYLVIPMVGFVDRDHTLTIDPYEVAEAFEVPLEFFLSPINRELHETEVSGRRRRYFAFRYTDKFIWGATAGMLNNLVSRIREA